MFKELVSLAIIAGFILNIIYVDHPNTTSYTIAFVLSLSVISPVVFGVRYWISWRQQRKSREMVEDAEELSLVGGSEEREAGIGGKSTRPSEDLEMGMGQSSEAARNAGAT